MARFDRFRAPGRPKGIPPALREVLMPPVWLPPGAKAYADFVQGRYYGDGGSIQTIEEIWVTNDDWGTFVESQIVVVSRRPMWSGRPGTRSR